VDGVRLSRHGQEAAARHEPRCPLGPGPADERIPVPVDDKGRLLDQRQPVLDAIGENRSGRRKENAPARRQIVAGGQRNQRERLAGRGAEGAEELMPSAPAGGIDGRADQDHRPHQHRPVSGELGHDLATHRIRDEGRAHQTFGFDPRAQRSGETTDADLSAQRCALALAR